MSRIIVVFSAAILVFAAEVAVSAVDSLSHQPKAGEVFVYSRVIDYSDSDGHHQAKSELTFKVFDPGRGALTIRAHTGRIVTRDVAIAPDGRWTFSDMNMTASNIAWYDPAFFGAAPANIQLGQTWQSQAAKTEMFVGGTQTVKVTSLGPGDVTITTVGIGVPEHGQVMDPDSHRTYDSFQQKHWTTTTTFHDGIATSFVRLERNVTRVDNVTSNDGFDVRMSLTSHTGG